MILMYHTLFYLKIQKNTKINIFMIKFNYLSEFFIKGLIYIKIYKIEEDE